MYWFEEGRKLIKFLNEGVLTLDVYVTGLRVVVVVKKGNCVGYGQEEHGTSTVNFHFVEDNCS